MILCTILNGNDYLCNQIFDDIVMENKDLNRIKAVLAK